MLTALNFDAARKGDWVTRLPGGDTPKLAAPQDGGAARRSACAT
jgi:hypothetical protein